MAESPEAAETPSAPVEGTTNTTFAIGDVVQDRENDDPNDAIVVNLPSKTAAEWIARQGSWGEATVAEDNPAYPADAPIVVVVFADALREAFPDWERETHLTLTAINRSDASHYSFPAPRLTVVDSSTRGNDSSPDASERTEADPPTGEAPSATARNDEESVTDPATDAATAEDETPASVDARTDASASMCALKERLERGGMTVEIEPDGQALAATKLGDTYRVRPGEIIEGEGALRSRLASIVAEYE
ncbi:hypothetical protein [Halocatena marina]|uniref:hypothetical protein n=1 Tax=Halocatena marina TaxID=2934937 RepID=UPI00200F8FCA|nr:hypothetical protein [Halocatena marina]